MTRVVVANIVSLDGYVADAGGNPLVLNMDDAFNAMNLERILAADAVLLGRKSFEMFSSHWPFIADAPADPANPALDETNRAISRRYNEIPKIVVSDSLLVDSGNGWVDSTTVVPRDQAAEWLATAPHAEVAVFGSSTMWNGLLAEGLVHELYLMVSPTVLGSGAAAFRGAASVELVEVVRPEGSANVVMRYRAGSTS